MRGVLLVLTLFLAACSAGGLGPSLGLSLGTPRDTPFAPGLARRGVSEDNLVIAHRLMQAGEFELALQAYGRAGLDRGMDADVLSGLGSASLGLGRLGQAETFLRRAIAAENAVPETWNNLGVVLMEKGDTAEAAEMFRRAVALDNGNSDSIRENFRLALAKSENPDYDLDQEQEYRLIRRGSSDYLLRPISG